MIDYLRRPLLNYWTARDGKIYTTPGGAIFGPKAMIINEFAGSGGDAMPWYFRKAASAPGRQAHLGRAGGHYSYPGDLMDGGMTGTPNFAFFTTDSKWEVENHGVDPDVEVEHDPAQWRLGHDTQLEKAVQVVLELMKKNPTPGHKRPPYPNYYIKTSAAGK